MLFKNILISSVFRLKASLVFSLLILGFSGAVARNYHVIKSTGTAAVINGGQVHGIHIGDMVYVGRFINEIWEEVTTAMVTEVKEKIARIEIVDDEAIRGPIREGDVVVCVIDRYQETGSFGGTLSRNFVEPEDIKTEEAVKGPQRFNQNGEFKGQMFYLGPTIGFFIPLGDMGDRFDTRVGYGGLIGVKFRRDLDISMRFFYAAKESDWSIWNLNLLGRKTFREYLIIDFGYGIFYPEKTKNWKDGSGLVSMGFSGGIGLTFRIGLMSHFEFGCLYHYYPNFGQDSGSIIILMMRLIL